jgi:hypothetical protein
MKRIIVAEPILIPNFEIPDMSLKLVAWCRGCGEITSIDLVTHVGKIKCDKCGWTGHKQVVVWPHGTIRIVDEKPVEKMVTGSVKQERMLSMEEMSKTLKKLEMEMKGYIVVEDEREVR